MSLICAPATAFGGGPVDPLASEAEAVEASGDWRGASWLWMRAAELRSNNPTYMMRAGIAAQEAGDCPRASRLLRRYVDAGSDDSAGNKRASTILAEIDASQCATLNQDEALEVAKELYKFAEAQASEGVWETAMYAYEDAYFLVPAKVGFAYKVGKSAFEAQRCAKAEEYLSHFARYGDAEKHKDLLRDSEGMLNRVETMGCGSDNAPPPVAKGGCSVVAGPSEGGAAPWFLLLCVLPFARARRRSST